MLSYNNEVNQFEFIDPLFKMSPGARFNIKTPSQQYGKSYVKNKTVVRSSYLYNIHYTLYYIIIHNVIIALCARGIGCE